MNSVFVGKKDQFSLTVWFKKDGALDVKKADDVTSEDKETYTPMTITFQFPDWRLSKRIVRRGTPYMSGVNQIDFGLLSEALMEELARGWDLKDDEQKPIEFELEKLNSLRPDIVRCFVELLREKLVEAGVWESLLNS